MLAGLFETGMWSAEVFVSYKNADRYFKESQFVRGEFQFDAKYIKYNHLRINPAAGIATQSCGRNCLKWQIL